MTSTPSPAPGVYRPRHARPAPVPRWRFVLARLGAAAGAPGRWRRLEEWLEDLVHRPFAGCGGLHPVEVARALGRECDARSVIVDAAHVLAPNVYTVGLAPVEHARLAAYGEPLTETLAAAVREHAAEQGYTLLGPVEVTLLPRPDAAGAVRVRSAVRLAQGRR